MCSVGAEGQVVETRRKDLVGRRERASSSGQGRGYRQLLSRSLRDECTPIVVRVAEGDLQRSQEGVKPRVLDWQHVRVLAGLIVVGVPITRWGDKARARSPVLAVRVFDHPIVAKLGPDQSVAARFAINYEIQRHGFVAVGEL